MCGALAQDHAGGHFHCTHGACAAKSTKLARTYEMLTVDADDGRPA
eukprot:CAMPEP_0181385892 /NCGR_PEP_ID=MMETSP1106-20121128/22819_1 /TAXON_ID=81844 /ORGANISM="Mantoniella antarctica, Strain SL-175" /LENGTH=45 /DNA_ID= /DNA_START= /DNA_END= /DNA_ORIENTATION=